jgi:caffeoyl-CoA O-methyltransferase
MPSKFTQLTDELHAYIVEHGARRDDALREVEAASESLGDRAVMQMAADQGALTTLLVRAIGARTALEVGTFTGYGAICIARGLGEGGRLITCEMNEDYAEMAARHFERAGVAGRIEIRIGPAIETLRALPDEPVFDFTFIDADKVGYPAYYEEALARTRPGGLIALDNVLLGGRVLDPDPDDDSAKTMRELNDRIVSDERVDVAMIGVADGITLALKR